jgi:hypothetical protein
MSQENVEVVKSIFRGWDEARVDGFAASTSARSDEGASTRTECPRPTSARAIARVGGTLPPPFQVTNRKRERRGVSCLRPGA